MNPIVNTAFCLTVLLPLTSAICMGEWFHEYAEGEKWTANNLQHICRKGQTVTLGCVTDSGRMLPIGQQMKEGGGNHECTKGADGMVHYSHAGGSSSSWSTSRSWSSPGVMQQSSSSTGGWMRNWGK